LFAAPDTRPHLLPSQPGPAALVRVSLDPVVAIGMLGLSVLAFGEVFESSYLILALLVFSLTFPGSAPKGTSIRALAGDVLTSWLVIVALLLLIGWATRTLGAFDLRVIFAWVLATPVALFAAHLVMPVVLPRLLAAEGVELGPLAARAKALREEGQTVVFLAVDGTLAGLIGVADRIKDSTSEAIRLLRAEGLRVVMLTGDNPLTAEAVARALRLDDVIADVQPADKAAVIERLQAEGHVVAMAGDGINDAPALARAHVGIAMGTGTDVAMESAAITLVKGDFRGIVRARRLSRATMRNIRQNLWWAFVYNALGVPIAAGVLYPVSGVLLSPMIASAAMSLSSVSVIANALRLRRLSL